MIDAHTEDLYGAFPPDRKLIAKAIDKLVAANVEGIVLKFFYDLPSTEESDHCLETSICAANVALQACIEESNGSTNRLETKFELPGPVLPNLLSGNKGFVPLERFRRCASGVGFVDFANAEELSLIELYQGTMVKSLYLIALEMAAGQKASLTRAGIVQLDQKHVVKFTNGLHHIDLPLTDSLEYIPFDEVVSETSKTWQSKVAHSVVVIGYDGDKIHRIKTSIGPVGAHRHFIYGLKSLVKYVERRASEDSALIRN